MHQGFIKSKMFCSVINTQSSRTSLYIFFLVIDWKPFRQDGSRPSLFPRFRNTFYLPSQEKRAANVLTASHNKKKN